jgi:hypothetical protein
MNQRKEKDKLQLHLTNIPNDDQKNTSSAAPHVINPQTRIQNAIPNTTERNKAKSPTSKRRTRGGTKKKKKKTWREGPGWANQLTSLFQIRTMKKHPHSIDSSASSAVSYPSPPPNPLNHRMNIRICRHIKKRLSTSKRQLLLFSTSNTHRRSSRKWITMYCSFINSRSINVEKEIHQYYYEINKNWKSEKMKEGGEGRRRRRMPLSQLFTICRKLWCSMWLT